MKTMKDYDDLYLKYDVLLLADMFESFSNKILINYELCPSHYLSAPALNLDAVLNMTKVEFELILDTDIYLFFEKYMRIPYISNRYCKTINKYLKTYEPKQEWKRIVYLYANNLYDCAMSKFLPTSWFKWINPKEFEVNNYTSNSSIWCVLEVHLEYPKELDELHNDYPLTQDKLEIKRMMSSYQLKIADFYNIPIGNVKNLVPNFSW